MTSGFAKGIPLVAGLLAALTMPGQAAQAAVLSDGGFEAQGATVGPAGYCYMGASVAGSAVCGAGAWTGGGDGGGIQSASNSAWPGIPTLEGSYYGFVQTAGFLSQVFTITSSGNYVVNWLDAGRVASGGQSGNQAYDAILTNLTTNSVTTLSSYATTTAQAWTARAMNTTLAGGTSYRLTFQGKTTNDNTAFIDAVAVNAVPVSTVPEPSSWGLMMVGFGTLAFVMRRRRALHALRGSVASPFAA
ncbi:PEP-CTERM sorting domain-containing protein [Novosphingobium flavum]|uniref:PEP-CTERM sorting domain-containing protein n=1 Tax=Novosphingobium aerophilum TaxID=2839843 RepID=UPI00163B39E1|nr:PEP-CTERM sorting domain-containing protein [Novosphingobium aerophilum]MBC2660608.1 PEP-CTERM sorting domain-containing protein [Novosphingobium aerophilum]